MKDQAERLRQRIQSQNESRQTKIVAIVSGKGGVGKSNFSLNFALSLEEKKQRVLLFDMDIGMGNIDILMGKSSSYTIVDFFNRQIPLSEVILSYTNNIDYIAGGTGLAKVMQLDENAFNKFASELELILNDYDYIIFDMGAGMNDDDLQFILSVHEVIVVTLPEPPAIMDAYAVMKHLHLLDAHIPQYLVVNRVQSNKEGRDTAERLSRVSKSFLGKSIVSLGMIPDDKYVKRAVSSQIPLLKYNNRSPAARAIQQISDKYADHLTKMDTNSNAGQFIKKLTKFFFNRKVR